MKRSTERVTNQLDPGDERDGGSSLGRRGVGHERNRNLLRGGSWLPISGKGPNQKGQVGGSRGRENKGQSWKKTLIAGQSSLMKGGRRKQGGESFTWGGFGHRQKKNDGEIVSSQEVPVQEGMTYVG